MSSPRLFFSWLGLRSKSDPWYKLPESLNTSLVTLANYEGRPTHELILDILAAGLTQYSTKDRIWKKWESLTAREQETAALACLGYTNGQIATKMGITLAGAKFHLGNIYQKVKVKNRAGLRKKFTGWDFSAYDKTPKGYHFLKSPEK